MTAGYAVALLGTVVLFGQQASAGGPGHPATLRTQAAESGSSSFGTISFRAGEPRVYDTGDCSFSQCPSAIPGAFETIRQSIGDLKAAYWLPHGRIVVRAHAHTSFWGEPQEATQYELNVSRRRAEAVVDAINAAIGTERVDGGTSEPPVIVALGQQGVEANCPFEEDERTDDETWRCESSRQVELYVCWGGADCPEEQSTLLPPSASGKEHG